MRLSLNEIENAARKAGRGAGLPTGLADDAGRAAARLHGHGINGAALLLQALTGQQIAMTVSALDRVAAGAPEAQALNLTAPAFALGLALVAAEEQNSRFAITLGGGGFALISAGMLHLEGALPETPGAIRISPYTAEVPGDGMPQPLFDVADGDWSEIGALAARTYVPASEQSRLAGAGAGLTDND